MSTSSVEKSVAVLFGAVIVTSAFTWSRFVLPGGSPIPVQRVIALLFIASVVVYSTMRGWRGSRGVLPLVALGGAWLVWIGLVVLLLSGQGRFQMAPALLDVSKYGLNVVLAIAVAYCVRAGVFTPKRIGTLLMWAATLAVGVALLCLVMYLLGARIIDGYVLRTFGDAWGVWPTSGVVPRLVGTTAEPQQLSVVFVTGLLVAVQRPALRYQILGLAGIAVLLLSQSKFALASILVVAVVWGVVLTRRIATTRRARLLVATSSVVLLGVLGAVAAQLPTFQESMQKGFSAGAFTERADNATILVEAFTSSPVVGIGPGQFGAFRSRVLREAVDNSYYPNNDYLKVLSETGFIGLGLMALLLVFVAYCALRALRPRSAFGANNGTREVAVAATIGALLIALNMIIGYELLHVFFWINCGLLVGLGSRSLLRNSHPRHTRASARA